MTLEERLAAISNKAEKDKIKEYNEKLNEQNKIENALNKIKELEPRIRALITLGNKCIEEKIQFPSSSETTKLGYGSGYNSYDFCADGFYHHVGFMNCKRGFWRRDEFPFNEIEYLGIYNGGACGVYNFYTNGTKTFCKHERTGEIIEAKLEHMKKFLKEFDSFEAAFYKWIDSMAEIKTETNFSPSVEIKTERLAINVNVLNKKELVNNKGKKFYVVEVKPEIIFILDSNNNFIDSYCGEIDEDEDNLKFISSL